MKIAIVCFNLSWQAGGVRLIFSEAHELIKLGHEVIIFAPEFDTATYPALQRGLDIRVVNPPEPIHWQYKSRFLLVRIFEKLNRERLLDLAGDSIVEAMGRDYDIVNLHDFSYRLAPAYRSKNPDCKMIWTMNDPPYMYLPKENLIYDLLSRFFNWYKDIVERSSFEAIDKAIVLLARNKKWLKERGVSAEVVQGGIYFEDFFSPVKSIKGKRSVSLLAVGALNKYRRFEDLIRAVSILEKGGYKTKTTVVCNNIWREEGYKSLLEDLVRSLSLDKSVSLLFKGAGEEDLRRIYKESDIFVLPIHLPPPRDGFGWQLVPFEAMAAGLPVVVSRKNDVTEALVDGETALFVDPMSPEAIAERIKSLIDKPETYRRIAENGQKFVKENMTWDKYAKEILRAVES